MSDLKWFQVFTGGDRTSSNGISRTYPERELDQVVEGYNPDKFKAPLIVSYPAHNTAGHSDAELHKSQLAFGYPEKLKREGDRLLAGFKKISPKVKEWINNGEILGFSSSFYLPDSPFNPTPGKLALRHIAGCGTNPPAVKGMPLPELCEPIASFSDYADEQEGAVEFGLDLDEQDFADAQLGAKVWQALKNVSASVTSFCDDPMTAFAFQAIGETFQRQRDQLIASKGIEEADKVFPQYVLSQLASTRVDAHYDRDDDEPTYQEKTVIDVETEAQFTELQAQNERLAQQVKALQAKNELDAVTSFVDGLVRDRKLTPGDRDSEIRDILLLPNKDVVDYGEDGELTQRQRYMNKLSARKPLWSDKRLPIGTGDEPENFGFASYGESFDADSIKSDRKIRAKCKEMGKDPSNAADYADVMTSLGIEY